eukprot:6207517-Pleurochrysis_carterae.AAC.5
MIALFWTWLRIAAPYAASKKWARSQLNVEQLRHALTLLLNQPGMHARSPILPWPSDEPALLSSGAARHVDRAEHEDELACAGAVRSASTARVAQRRVRVKSR